MKSLLFLLVCTLAQTAYAIRSSPATTTTTTATSFSRVKVQDNQLQYTVGATGAEGTTPLLQLHSGSTFFNSLGSQYGGQGGKAVNITLLDPTSGFDNLGAYTQQRVSFRPQASATTTSSTSSTGTTAASSGTYAELGFQSYPDYPQIQVLSQKYPNGNPNAAAPDSLLEILDVSSSFPCIQMSNGSSGNATGYVHFAGYMAGNWPQYGTWTNAGSTSLAGGTDLSGVLVLFNTTTNSAVVISPLTQFMSASLENSYANQEQPLGEVRWGLGAKFQELDPGFEASWILSFCDNCGVNKAVQQWGKTMRSFYSRSMTQAHSRDITLQYLGYATDNGAYYYYNDGNHTNYQDALIDLHQYLVDQEEIPVRSLEIDSWWYYRQNVSKTKGVPFSGVTNWTARPDIFPGGRKALHDKTHWRIQAHNRYWAIDNVYASNPQEHVGPTKYDGKHFEFVWGDGAGLPASSEFWDYLFSINDDWGLSLYIQDWFSITQLRMPQLSTNVSFGSQWLRGMNDGAQAHQVCVQFCMTFPRHVLQALELPAVTQVRASNDFQPQSTGLNYDQWRIAESALWVSALGIAPSKDSYWSMPTPQYTPHYNTKADTFETRNRLESVVASMSNGPVSISDRIGYSNKSLIMHCCNTEGLLLRPDVSAASMDKFFNQATGIVTNGGMQTGPATGILHATYSLVGGGQYPFVYILSVDNTLPDGAVTLTTEDIESIGIRHDRGEGAQLGASSLPISWFVYEHNRTSGLVVEVNASSPLSLATSTQWSFQYFTFAPNFQAGTGGRPIYSFLGEANKWIGASRQRIRTIEEDFTGTSGTLFVEVAGVWRENIELLFLPPGHSLQIVSHSCYVPETSQVTFKVAADGTFSCVS